MQPRCYKWLCVDGGVQEYAEPFRVLGCVRTRQKGSTNRQKVEHIIVLTGDQHLNRPHFLSGLREEDEDRPYEVNSVLNGKRHAWIRK